MTINSIKLSANPVHISLEGGVSVECRDMQCMSEVISLHHDLMVREEVPKRSPINERIYAVYNQMSPTEVVSLVACLVVVVLLVATLVEMWLRYRRWRRSNMMSMREMHVYRTIEEMFTAGEDSTVVLRLGHVLKAKYSTLAAKSTEEIDYIAMKSHAHSILVEEREAKEKVRQWNKLRKPDENGALPPAKEYDPTPDHAGFADVRLGCLDSVAANAARLSFQLSDEEVRWMGYTNSPYREEISAKKSMVTYASWTWWNPMTWCLGETRGLRRLPRQF